MKTVNPLHRSDRLHRDAGTYYHSTYADAGHIYSLFDSFSWANQLMLDDALDASKLFVRTLITPLHCERFMPLRIFENAYRNGEKKMIFYGQENLRYGDSHYYGHPSPTIPGAVELPAGVVDVDLCCDLPIDPGIVLLKNEHFFIRSGHLFFTVDLFDLMPISETADSDRSVTIYLRGVSVDRRYVQDRLGILLQTQGPSTQAFVEFNNLVMDSIMEGTSYHRLSQLLGKLYDVPCTKETETVESTGFDQSSRWQATDRAVYFAPLSARFLYESGKTIQAGTFLTDAVEPVRGKILPDGIPIILERRFLGSDYKAGLIFPNEESTLSLDRQIPYPTFLIVGRDEDIMKFWNTFYERMDDRAILSDASVGGTINPARFVYQNILYPRAQFYRVYREKCGPDILPVINSRLFRGLLPPGVLFSVLTVSQAGSFELAPLKFESMRTEVYSAAKPVASNVPLHCSTSYRWTY